MAEKTPEQISAKYGRRVAAAGQDYADGVMNPSRPWAEATVAGAARYQQGLQESIAEKRFERGVQRAGNAKWQERASTKGQTNYTAAANEAAAAYSQRAGEVMAAASAARQAAERIPTTTQEERIQRSVAAMRATSQYWRSRRGGGG